ncbi:MAG: hypothetical protein MJ252_25610, partial [archaeon]|nr:hypothetical protein [archaeon]
MLKVLMEKTDLETKKFFILMRDKLTQQSIENISLDNMQFYFKNSLLRVFGCFAESKVFFNLNKLKDIPNGFEISYSKKERGTVISSLVLIADLEYDIRIRFLEEDINNKDKM